MITIWLVVSLLGNEPAVLDSFPYRAQPFCAAAVAKWPNAQLQKIDCLRVQVTPKQFDEMLRAAIYS